MSGQKEVFLIKEIEIIKKKQTSSGVEKFNEGDKECSREHLQQGKPDRRMNKLLQEQEYRKTVRRKEISFFKK